MGRRSRKHLELQVANADSRGDKALPHFQLEVFYDNNSRERVAISHYRRALQLGLPENRKSEAPAWLASSHYKINCSKELLKLLAMT